MKKPKFRLTKKWRDFLISFGIGVGLFGIALIIGINVVLSDTAKSGGDITDEPDNTGEVITPIETAPEDTYAGKTFTALLMGEGALDLNLGRTNVDSLILLKVDRENKQIIISPLPTEMRVVIVDDITREMGTLAQSWSSEFLKKKVAAITGIRVDCFIYANNETCEEAIRELYSSFGSITVNVPEDMNYTDPYQDLVIDIKAGKQTLSAEDTVKMLRYAGYANGAEGRRSLQVEFLKSAIKTLCNASLKDKMSARIDKVLSKVETDITQEFMMNNIDLISDAGSFTIVTVNYPVKNLISGTDRYTEADISRAISQVYNIYR